MAASVKQPEQRDDWSISQVGKNGKAVPQVNPRGIAYGYQHMIIANSRELARRRGWTAQPQIVKGGPVMVMDAKRLLGTNTFAATEQHVSVARRWVRDLLSGHIDEETLYDVTLCAAELADNARKHGPTGGAISAAVYLCGNVVRLEVTNDAVSLTRPHVTDAWFSTEGHGLQIVSDLAKDWGTYENDDLEQVVWCEPHADVAVASEN